MQHFRKSSKQNAGVKAVAAPEAVNNLFYPQEPEPIHRTIKSNINVSNLDQDYNGLSQIETFRSELKSVSKNDDELKSYYQTKH